MKKIKLIITPRGWDIKKEGYSDLEVIAILDIIKLGFIDEINQQLESNSNSLPNYQKNAQS